MSNNNDNKISIQVEINANGQQQITQYKNAFDGLRTSINNLSVPVSKLDGEISKLNDNLSKADKQNQNFGSTIKRVKDGVFEAIDIFDKLKKGVEILKISFSSLEASLTLGLSVVIAFLPEIINFTASLLKGREAVNVLSLSFQNLNAARKAANADIATENTKLQMLYKSATDLKNSHEDRVKSIQALQQAFPQHFKGLKEEDFLNGKAKTGFDAATKSILETARAKAALSKITEEANKIANAEYQIEKIKSANHDEKLKKERELAKEPRRFRDIDPKIKLANYNKDSDERAKKTIAAEQKKIDESNSSIKTLTKFGGGTNKIAKAMAGDNSSNEPLKSLSYLSVQSPKTEDNTIKEAEQERLASIARMAEISLEGYAKEVMAVDTHFKQLKEKYKNNKQTLEQLEKERVAAIEGINKKFQDEDLKKLEDFKQQLLKIRSNATKTVEQLAIQQVEDEYSAKLKEVSAKETLAQQQQQAIAQQQQKLRSENREKEANELDKALQIEKDTIIKAGEVKALLEQDQINAIQKIKDDAAKQESQKKQQEEEAKLTENIQKNKQEGHIGKALQDEMLLMDMQRAAKLNDKQLTEEQIFKIEEEYARKKAAIEDQLMSSKIHAGDKFIDAALKNSKKDSAIYKAAFLAKKATSIADTIITTKRAVMESLKAYAFIPFVGQALGIVQAAFMAGQGAISIAEIAKQKPGFARGGQFRSDGRGSLLSGYSRVDDTNAYLRSGEAVVVSEAMRNQAGSRDGDGVYHKIRLTRQIYAVTRFIK